MNQAVYLIVFAAFFTGSEAISCFECDSSKNFSCSEYWDPTLEVATKFISDCNHVFEASYCIKMTGVFEGKLGTKRFCSSRNWGNYCEYIQRPGDIQEYRSCIFSCETSVCNISPEILPALLTTWFFPLTMAVLSRTFFSAT